jgi:hypothetical protein
MENGALLRTRNIASAGGSWDVQGVPDFDSDGDADVLWRHETTGQIVTWEMEGAQLLRTHAVGCPHYRPPGHANGSCGVRSKVGRRTLLTMLGTSTQFSAKHASPRATSSATTSGPDPLGSLRFTNSICRSFSAMRLNKLRHHWRVHLRQFVGQPVPLRLHLVVGDPTTLVFLLNPQLVKTISEPLHSRLQTVAPEDRVLHLAASSSHISRSQRRIECALARLLGSVS